MLTMIRRDVQDIPNPEERPEAFKEEDVLSGLYVERGWPRREIAEHFDVSESEVRKFLKRHGITRNNSQIPTTGLAREIWEKGKAEAVE